MGIIRYINLMSIDQKAPVLVTGLSGMVGTRFQQLYKQKYALSGVDLSSGVDITNKKAVFRSIEENPGDRVIHLAAFTNVSAAYEQNGEIAGSCYQVNVVGTQNVVDACNEFNKYLIHISTDFVFDGSKKGAYTETDVPHPIEWYGMTKFLAEQLVTKEMPKAVILRIAYPYQACPNRPDFLKNLRDKLSAGTLPRQFSDHVITPTFVDDLAKVLDYCLINKPKGLYHAVGTSSMTDFDLANEVRCVFNLNSTIESTNLDEYLKRVNRPYQKQLRISNVKLTSEFGISMKTFSEGLKEIRQQLPTCN
jgi:dTDP-4-dehydrorhamnose reductase